MLIAVYVAASSVAGVVFRDLPAHKAFAQAAAEQKLVLMYYKTSWCAPCRVMEATTFQDPQVAAWVAQHAIALKVDGDHSRGLADRFDIERYPLLVFVDADRRPLDRVVGSIDAPRFLSFASNVLAGNYGTASAGPPRPAQSGPRLIASHAPTFPEQAISQGLGGYVLVRFTVTRTGGVRDPDVVESEPARVFDRAALRAIKRYRFQPALQGGKPVEVTNVRRRISFAMRPR